MVDVDLLLAGCIIHFRFLRGSAIFWNIFTIQTKGMNSLTTNFGTLNNGNYEWWIEVPKDHKIRRMIAEA